MRRTICWHQRLGSFRVGNEDTCKSFFIVNKSLNLCVLGSRRSSRIRLLSWEGRWSWKGNACLAVDSAFAGTVARILLARHIFSSFAFVRNLLRSICLFVRSRLLGAQSLNVKDNRLFVNENSIDCCWHHIKDYVCIGKRINLYV